MTEKERLAKKRAYQRQYRQANKEKIRQESKEYTKKNRDKINARQKQRYAENPEKFKERSRRKYKANPDADKDRARRARKRDPERARIYARRSTLKRRYGLTEAQFYEMLSGQDRKCVICLRPFSDNLIPAVDHCHKTGAVRGLLCRPCNTGIALLHEDEKVMLRAIDYLKTRILK